MRSLHVDELLSAARSVGIKLRGPLPQSETHNLYIWTNPAGEVLYIGKAASRRRTLEEETWAKAYNSSSINIGFTVLINRHSGVPQLFFSDGVDNEVVERALDGWEGPAVEAVRGRVDAGTPWSSADIEMVLIRMAVLSGYPIANAVGSGQWEGQMGRDDNTLAAVAVVNSDTLRYERVEQTPSDLSQSPARDR